MNLICLEHQHGGFKNMSRTRRNFSAKFNSDLVLEVLKGEKEPNVITTENNIQPNLLRNWKKEFLEKASVVFDDTREENLKKVLRGAQRERCLRKEGRLAHHAGGLVEKNLRRCLDLTTRVNLVRSRTFRSVCSVRLWSRICFGMPI